MGRQLFLLVSKRRFTADCANIKHWSKLSILHHFYCSYNLPFDHRIDSFGRKLSLELLGEFKLWAFQTQCDMARTG